jgi:diacylglycerol kinase (ATP)
MTQEPALLIINNAAAKARRLWPRIEQALQSGAIAFELYETSHAGDATGKVRAAIHSGCETIGVIGGDGTLSEAAAGFFAPAHRGTSKQPTPINPQAALAVLPAGTGDDFARGLSGSRASLDHFLKLFIDHCHGAAPMSRLIDVIHGACDDSARDFICLNASTMGIGGETGARVAAQGRLMRSFSGEVRFMTAAIGALAAWRERRVRVCLDEKEVVDGPMNLVAVANGLYAGGGMMLSPAASIDDGTLDVVTVSGLTRMGIVRELPRIHRGGHVANPKVRIMQGQSVTVETFAAEDGLLIEADGNVRGRTPARFRLLPRVLRFVTG